MNKLKTYIIRYKLNIRITDFIQYTCHSLGYSKDDCIHDLKEKLETKDGEVWISDVRIIHENELHHITSGVIQNIISDNTNYIGNREEENKFYDIEDERISDWTDNIDLKW